MIIVRVKNVSLYVRNGFVCNPYPRNSLIDPDDRKAAMEALVRIFFSAAPTRESLIIKVNGVGCTVL
jgi:hypothetical protein